MRTLKRSDCAVLPLVLKRKWYDMIASGEKNEEYRDATEYWKTRICNWEWHGTTVVEFRLGYAKNAPRMAFRVRGVAQIRWGAPGHPEWGEPYGKHYAIFLDERVILEG